MVLPNVAQGDPHVAAHNAERAAINAIDAPQITFWEDFSRVTLGALPGPSSTAYENTIGDSGDEVAGGVVITAVADDLFVGGRCANFTNPSVLTNTYGFLGKSFSMPASNKIYFERFYKIDVAPQFRTSVLLYKNTDINGSHLGSFSFGGSASSYKFVLVNVDTNSTVSSATVPVGAWFRVVIMVDTLARTQTADLYLGSNIFGVNPTETITAAIGPGTFAYFEDGMLTNPNLVMNIKMSHPTNSTAKFRPPIPGVAGPTGATGSSGVVVLSAGAPDPTPVVSGVLYLRKLT